MTESLRSHPLDDSDIVTPEYQNAVWNASKLSRERFTQFTLAAVERIKGTTSEEDE